MSSVDKTLMEISSKPRILRRMEPTNRNTRIDPVGIGERLRAIRESEQMQSGEFALSVGIDPSSYSKIEQGKKALKMEMGYQVAERYGVTMDFIYRGRLNDLPQKLAEHLRQTWKKKDI